MEKYAKLEFALFLIVAGTLLIGGFIVGAGLAQHTNRLDSHAASGTKLEFRVSDLEVQVLRQEQQIKQLERRCGDVGRKFAEWEKNGVGQRR